MIKVLVGGGRTVRIVDLAADPTRLSGLRPHVPCGDWVAGEDGPRLLGAQLEQLIDAARDGDSHS